MKVYVLSKPDGSVAIMRCINNADPLDEVRKWYPADQAKVMSIKEIAESDLPINRIARNAWVLNGTKVEVDAAKALTLYATSKTT